MSDPAAANTIAAVALASGRIMMGRREFERVMDSWNGRMNTLSPKLEEAWRKAADVLVAQARAAERQRIRDGVLRLSDLYALPLDAIARLLDGDGDAT